MNKKDIFTVPNFISVFRVIMTFYAFWLFTQNHDKVIFLIFTFLSITLDGLDGIIARKFNQATPLGAKIDIYGDRLTELSYWLFFWWLGLLGIWVFIFFLVRGITVDYLTRKQVKPLGNSFLRSSRFMRFLYGFLKLLSFAMLIYCPILLFKGFNITLLVVYATVIVCFLRALPVYLEHYGN